MRDEFSDIQRKYLKLISREKPQFLAIAALSIGAVGLAGIIHFSNAYIFKRFIGSINPLAASLLVSFPGFIFLTFLLSQGWFTIYKKENLEAVLKKALRLGLLADSRRNP